MDVYHCGHQDPIESSPQESDDQTENQISELEFRTSEFRVCVCDSVFVPDYSLPQCVLCTVVCNLINVAVTVSDSAVCSARRLVVLELFFVKTNGESFL